MKLQQHRFKFLTISKNIAIVTLLIGFVFSVQSILNFNKARRIEAMSTPEFRQLIETYKFQNATLRTLQAVAKKALEIVPEDTEAAEKANNEILKKKSNCLDCQNRIIYFDLKKNVGLSEEGLRALRSSYELSPYGEFELLKWRLEISSKYWNDLDEELQRSALSQITSISQYHKGRTWLVSLETDVESINDRIKRIAS